MIRKYCDWLWAILCLLTTDLLLEFRIILTKGEGKGNTILFCFLSFIGFRTANSNLFSPTNPILIGPCPLETSVPTMYRPLMAVAKLDMPFSLSGHCCKWAISLVCQWIGGKTGTNKSVCGKRQNGPEEGGLCQGL